MQALAVGSGPGVEEDKAGVRWGVCVGGRELGIGRAHTASASKRLF